MNFYRNSKRRTEMRKKQKSRVFFKNMYFKLPCVSYKNSTPERKKNLPKNGRGVRMLQMTYPLNSQNPGILKTF